MVESREIDGWPRHFACCQPVDAGSKYPYCHDHLQVLVKEPDK